MSTNFDKEYRRKDHHRSVFFPVLLILIGVFFLLSNLNLMPGNAWSIFVRFWPVLFIIGSFDDLINQKWVGALMNFGIGSILLLANLGYFSWTAWQLITRLWPVFIIAVGLDVIFRGQSVLGSLIGVGISILVLGGLIWFALQGPLMGNTSSLNINYGLEGAGQAEILAKPAVGSVYMSAADLDEDLINGKISLAKEETLTQEYDVKNGVGNLYLSSEGTVVFFSQTTGNGFPWDLELNDDVPMIMTIDQGIGQQTLNLDGLNLTSFNIKLGIGSARITLPTEEQFEAKIECGIGEVVIIVPENLSVKIKLDSAISGVDFPSDFIREGDWIYSPNAKNNPDSSVLSLNNAIGSVKILSSK
jgi:hypothetical protein